MGAILGLRTKPESGRKIGTQNPVYRPCLLDEIAFSLSLEPSSNSVKRAQPLIASDLRCYTSSNPILSSYIHSVLLYTLYQNSPSTATRCLVARTY